MAHPLQAFFGRIRLFSTLTADELNDVLRAVRPLQLPAGQRLFRQGQAGDAAFVVESGAVEIYTEGPGGEVVVATLGPGEVIGELSLLDGSPRSASARAQGDTSLFRLDKQEFDFLRQNLRPAAYKLMRSMAMTLCDRLRETNDHIGDLLAPPPDAKAEAPPARAKGGWLSRVLFRGDR